MLLFAFSNASIFCFKSNIIRFGWKLNGFNDTIIAYLHQKLVVKDKYLDWYPTRFERTVDNESSRQDKRGNIQYFGIDFPFLH